MKRAIVIGASSGIGFEVARQLLNEGWKVGVAARRIDLLQNVGNVDAAEQIDVNDPNATEQLREMISQLGGMDLFFYAAGIGKQNRELHEHIEIQTATTNGVGFVRMIGEAYRYFAEKGEGHIAAITSIAGTKGLGPSPAYSSHESHAERLYSGIGTAGTCPWTEHILHRHPSWFCQYRTAQW